MEKEKKLDRGYKRLKIYRKLVEERRRESLNHEP